MIEKQLKVLYEFILESEVTYTNYTVSFLEFIFIVIVFSIYYTSWWYRENLIILSHDSNNLIF
jgi:hypothetical protein